MTNATQRKTFLFYLIVFSHSNVIFHIEIKEKKPKQLRLHPT